MTHDTKATLLDASHDAYVRLMAAARRSEPHNGYGEADIVSDELILRSHITALEAKNKRLVEVLRIYANPDNFFNSNGQCYEFDCVSPDVTEEPKYLGATARHILAQTGEKS